VGAVSLNAQHTHPTLERLSVLVLFPWHLLSNLAEFYYHVTQAHVVDLWFLFKQQLDSNTNKLAFGVK
jgi:hypothetical protein